MDALTKGPEFLRNLLPEGIASYVWCGILGLGSLLALVVLLKIFGLLFGGRRAKASAKIPKLTENLAEYPPLKSSTGDRQLRIEGVPVRLRLVVVAPGGTEAEANLDDLAKMLDRVVSGLGDIYKHDKPRVREWPVQLSFEGFANHFHRQTLIPNETDGEQSVWVVLAGRAKLGKFQVFIGLALQAIKPTTIGRKTIEAHEWDSVIRVRVRD
jgi:hypothetical protein